MSPGTQDRRADGNARRRSPLAAGRFSLAQGVMAGMGALSLGALDLHFFANPLTTLLALLTAFAYVAVYTPLKRVTPLATFIGAFPAPWADAGMGQRRVDASSGPALRSSPFSWSGNFPTSCPSPGSIAKTMRARAFVCFRLCIRMDGPPWFRPWSLPS